MQTAVKKVVSKYPAATHFLSAIDADWTKLIETIGACSLDLRLEREPYEALVRAVAHQQLHGKAAEAILGRLKVLSGGLIPTPQQMLALDFDTLRSCGFSGSKIATIKGIAEGALAGLVPPLAEAENMSDEELITRLVSLRGIGRWTVEMLLIFTLARQDILPVDDFAVREGYRRLKTLDKAPTPKALKLLGEAWSPYRTIAAWYLWRVPK